MSLGRQADTHDMFLTCLLGTRANPFPTVVWHRPEIESERAKAGHSIVRPLRAMSEKTTKRVYARGEVRPTGLLGR